MLAPGLSDPASEALTETVPLAQYAVTLMAESKMSKP
jgi:hypothetical protein